MTLYYFEELGLAQTGSVTGGVLHLHFSNLRLWSFEPSLPAWRSSRQVGTHHPHQRKAANKWLGICKENGSPPEHE
jgi:hypothetical protein